MKEALYYETNSDNSVNCGLCPHRCMIPLGKKGRCGVRHNQDGILTAESYERVTSIALDPIRKKPLYHFYPNANILSVGSYGCNFKCGFCQNHSISMAEAPWQSFTAPEIAAISKELSGQGNIGAAFTYNEPLIGYEFVKDCAELIAEQGQKNVLVTNGFVCLKPISDLLPLIHAMNIDLKSFNDEFYREIDGRLDEVKRTIELVAPHCHVEITTLIIPGKNDSCEEMDALSTWLSNISRDIPLHISRFFPKYKLLDVPPTPAGTIHRLVKTAERHLRYVYPGNC